MTLRDRLIGGAVDGLMLAIDTITSFWQTPREVEWAKAAAHGLAEREAEEEVAEPRVPLCANCDARLGEIAAQSQIVEGMFCSVRCVSVAEVRDAIKTMRAETSAPTPGAVDGPAVGSPDKPTAVVGLGKVVDECLADLARLRLAPSAEVEPPASAPSVESPAPEFDWVTAAIPVIAGVLAEHMAEQHRSGPVLCHDSCGCIHAEFADWQGWRDHVAPHIAIDIQSACVTTTHDIPSGDRPRPLADFPKHQTPRM